MYNFKCPKKGKNYWEKLVEEVAQARTDGVSVNDEAIKYTANDARRVQKYTLHETPSGIYFTQREAECVIQLMRGKTMNEAGEALKLSPRTVEYYLEKIKRKLNCRKKRDLINLISATDFVKNFEKEPYNQTKNKKIDF